MELDVNSAPDSGRTSIPHGGTAAQTTLKGTQGPLVLSSKHSRLTVAAEWLPSLGWVGGRGQCGHSCPSQACSLSGGLPHPASHSLIHLVRRDGGNCQGPGAVLGAGEEFSGNILSHRLEEKK